ncbi:MAG: membrane dipeptidase [Candidatus Rokubacteria bacterium]|nr:membrane dipeptidase [Candidatus Rokubacteria bacterium]
MEIKRWKLTCCCGHGDPSGRRDFLKTAALGTLGLAALGRAGAAEAQVRVFPPPPPLTSPIEGMIDFHVHSSPDVFGRAIDDNEITRKAVEARMGALVLKNHVMETGARAYLARKMADGKIPVFGGIVLNGPYGINPEAVQWMWRMEGGYGRVVWLPTFDADNHVKTFKDAPEGMKVVDAQGKVLPAVTEVMKICAKQNLVLCTGHASATESLALVKQARDVGVKHVVVTHAMFTVVNMTTAQMKQAAQMGAKIEIDFLGALMGPQAHLGWMRHWKQVSVKDNANAIKEIGAQHVVLGSDLGQTGNPSHIDGLKAMVAGLKAEGISDAQIKMVARDNVAAMLGL